MSPEQVAMLIQAQLPNADVQITGADCNFAVTVVCERFQGMSQVKRQQAVLASVRTQLASGELHAMSVSALTPEEASVRKPGLIPLG